MESNSEEGRIQVSQSTYERVKHLQMEFEERKLEVKGKGSMLGYLLNDMYHLRARLNEEDETMLVKNMRMEMGMLESEPSEHSENAERVDDEDSLRL